MSDVELPEESIVIYTDGGCVENKYAAWAFHGYTYNYEKPKTGTGIVGWVISPTKYYPKDQVLNEKELKVIWGPMYSLFKTEGYKNVNVTGFVDATGIIDGSSTNNVGELTGLLKALEMVIEKQYKRVFIITDSEYTLKGFTNWMHGWADSGWRTKGGDPVGNKEIWVRLLELDKELLELGIDLDISWVKGHSDDLGNDKADYNCTLGTLLCRRGVSMEDKVTWSDFKKYFKPDVTKNPLITHSNFYFNTNTSSNLRNVYCFGDHGKKDDFIGKPVSDSSFSIIKTNDPEPVLEIIKNTQDKIVPTNSVSLVLVKLPVVYKASVNKEITENDGIYLHRKTSRPDLYDSTKLKITETINPPRLAWKLIDLLTSVYKQFKVETRDPRTVITDITDEFYTVGKKTTLKKDFNNAVAYFKVSTKSCLETIDSDIPITLSVGIDIPNRNTMSKLASVSPKVLLLTWPEAKSALRYAVIIETNVGSGIYGGFYSNLVLIQK